MTGPLNNAPQQNPANDAFARIMKDTVKFVDRDRAFAYANGCTKAQWVMLGDDGRYWITTPANCARLEKMGYEFAL